MSETKDQEPKTLVGTINKAMQENKVSQLAPGRVMLAEYAHQTFVAMPEADTPFEAVLDSKYWAHYAVNTGMEMKPGDIILVKPEDGTYFAELIVRSKYRGGVLVAALRKVDLNKAVEAEQALELMGDPDYEIRHSGARLKWRVIRKSDKRELTSGHETRDAAQDWLKEHKKALAA